MNPDQTDKPQGSNRQEEQRRGSTIRWMAAAAGVVLVLVAGAFIFERSKKALPVGVSMSMGADKPAGANKFAGSFNEAMDANLSKGSDNENSSFQAVLTLSGNQQVFLDSAEQDTMLTEGGDIVAISNGQLAYNVGTNQEVEVLSNNLTTLKDGRYQLGLPDGTRAWLNAASSITFPTRFTGAARAVTVSGEVYLEVARDTASSFFVRLPVSGKIRDDSASSLEVEVSKDVPVGIKVSLDIKFSDNPSACFITPLGGNVLVKANGRRHSVHVGEQAVVGFPGRGIDVRKGVDRVQVLAWRGRY